MGEPCFTGVKLLRCDQRSDCLQSFSGREMTSALSSSGNLTHACHKTSIHSPSAWTLLLMVTCFTVWCECCFMTKPDRSA